MVVRGLLPAGVAAALGVGTVLAMCAFWPPAGLALGVCLLLAGVVAPAIAARAARSTEQRALQSRADMTATALGLLDDAGPLLVGGRADAELAALRESDRRLAAATDAGAGPAAIAAGLGQLAVGVAMLAALLTGVPAVGAGLLTPVELAVVVLTPLAAFEATSLLPAAAIQVQRSRAAAARVLALLDAPDRPAADGRRPRPAPAGRDRPRLPAGPARRPSSRSSPSTCGPAGPSRSSDRPAAARRPPCSRSRDCSPGRPAPSRSTGTTSTTSTGTPSPRRSSSAPRTRTSSGPPCWRTCASDAAT